MHVFCSFLGCSTPSAANRHGIVMFAAPNILENATMHFHFPQSINQSIKLARSKFTMAPRGDRPWSQRFFEAIMAGSIPVVQSREHTGRGPRERGLGYKVYMQNDETKYVYREDWARHNLEVFIRHQSMLRLGTKPYWRGKDGPGPLLSALPYIMNRTLALRDFHFEGQDKLPSVVEEAVETLRGK